MSAWTDIEDAVARWVTPASGLTAKHVVWDYWKAPRPAAPFVELSITDESGVGEAWLVKDEAPDSQPGAERRVRARSHREVTLMVQVYGGTDSGNTSWPIASQIARSIDLYVYQLDLAGVGVGDVGAVQNVEGRKGGTLEPRSRLQVTLHVGAEVESRVSYFSTMELTFNIDLDNDGPPVSTTVEIDLPPP